MFLERRSGKESGSTYFVGFEDQMRHQACENTKCDRNVSIIHLLQSFPVQFFPLVLSAARCHTRVQTLLYEPVFEYLWGTWGFQVKPMGKAKKKDNYPKM